MMQYRVDLRSVAQRRLRVELSLERDPGADGGTELEFFLPVWTPGSYLIREYARHLSDVVAVDGASGAPLPIRKTRKNRYSVQVSADWERVVLRYQVYANALTVREAYVGSDFAFWNGACVYLWPVGRESHNARVQVDLPQHWSLHCAAKPFDADEASTFEVADLEEAVDTPCLALPSPRVLEFVVLGCKFRFVCAGLAGIEPPDTLIADVTSVIEQASCVFVDGELPFDEYTFLALFGGSGRGGLEHRKSATLLAPRTTFAPRKSYEEFVSLIAHEFLHVWNVTRMRPVELQRIDFERENYTNQLWLAEGATAYYDDLVCLRAGIVDAQTYLETLAGHIRNLYSMPGRFAQSLAESSFDAWIRFYRPDENTRNTTQNYYSNGALAALCLDARIRTESGGSRSLDHAMRALYAETSERGYSMQDIIRCISEAAGGDLRREIEDLVHSALDPDLDAAFAVYGLELRWHGDTDPYLGLQFRNGELRVSAVLDDTPAWRAGIAPGDEVLALADLRVWQDNWSAVLNQVARDGQPLPILLERQGRVLTMTVAPERRARARAEIRAKVRPTAQQMEQREAWLGETSRALT